MFKLLSSVLLIFLVGCSSVQQKGTKDRITELDEYWAEVSRCVNEGDFEGYKATIHDEGVLILGMRDKAEPLAEALKRWKVEFDDTKSGKIKAGVTFRVNKRLGDATTAFEKGMFLYYQVKADGTKTVAYIHMEALLVKQSDGWKIIMENQMSRGTKEEWDKLK